MPRLWFPAAVTAVVSAALTAAAADSPIAPGAKLEKLADGFLFTEGPAADAQGNVLFTDQPNDRIMCWSADGMTIDNEGNVNLTGRGVTIFDRTGRQVEHVDVPERWTGNICFTGKDRHALFITASRAIYSLRMRTAGVGSQ